MDIDEGAELLSTPLPLSMITFQKREPPKTSFIGSMRYFLKPNSDSIGGFASCQISVAIAISTSTSR